MCGSLPENVPLRSVKAANPEEKKKQYIKK